MNNLTQPLRAATSLVALAGLTAPTVAAEVDGAFVDASYVGPHLPPLPPPGTPAPTPEELVSDPERVSEHGVSLAFVRALMVRAAGYEAAAGEDRHIVLVA